MLEYHLEKYLLNALAASRENRHMTTGDDAFTNAIQGCLDMKLPLQDGTALMAEPCLLKEEKKEKVEMPTGIVETKYLNWQT